MTAPSPPDPLTSDPARAAADSIRGYWSQIWRSVLAWLDIGDDELLFLEGAEDFDKVGPTDAEVTQAKDVEGNVTLRSADVLEAIAHSLEHRQRNRGRAVRFRFLSTGGAGVEHGAPFGKGVGGLQLWREARASTDKAVRERDGRKIADFLIAEGKLPKSVQDFIREATDEVLWTELIAPIEWDLKAEATASIIRAVKDKLVVLGSHKHVSSDRAELVAEHLYAHANETATRQRDRSLGRAQLLRLFDETTRQSLPADIYESLISVLGSHLPAQAGVTTIGAQAPAIGSPPPLPPRYFERAAILDDVARRLETTGALVLEAGTGVGKSTIAAGHAAASSAEWGWVDLRGLDAAALGAALDRVNLGLTVEPGIQNLVLDDIAVPGDARPLEGRLARMRATLSARQGKLVVTSGASLPQRLGQALALGVEGSLQIKAFSRAEIARYLVERGCPNKHADTWAAFIELHTSGHAQLVHARVATLESDGFPEPDLADLPTTPPDVIEARAEARRLVSMLDERARELIYRLSLTIGAFTRAQAIAIAGLPPPLQEPGLVLDRLIGPWLEVVIDGLYRVSPLLKGMGSDVNGRSWTIDTHREIGRALARGRVLTPSDASSILMHATFSQDWATIGQLSYGLMRADTETWAALAQSISWFTLVGTGSAAAHLNAEPFTRFLIRLLQFRVTAAEGDSDRSLQILDAFDVELPVDTSDTPLLMARYFFLASVVLRTEVKLPITRLFDVGTEFAALSDRFAGELAGATSPEFDNLIAGPDGQPDKAGLFGFNLTNRLATRADLEALLEAIKGRDKNLLRRLMWFMGARETTAGLVLDRVWLAEREQPTPDWAGLRELFERTAATAKWIGLPGLAHAAAREVVRIDAENLKDPEAALKSADAFGADLGWSPHLENEKASVLLNSDRPAKAMEIWRRLLADWRPRDEFDLQIPYSCRLAAIAAAKLGAWQESAAWLRRARDAIGEDEATFRAGLLMDEGFALWKAGDNVAALDRFTQGCLEIDALPADADDRKAFLVRKWAGHTLMWVAARENGRTPEGYSEPRPAECSNLEDLEHPDLRPTPSAGLWLHLAEFEVGADLGDAVFRQCEAKLSTTPYVPFRVWFGVVRIRQRLRSLAFDDLVDVAADWAEALELARIHFGAGGRDAVDQLPADAPPVDRSQLNVDLIRTALVNAVFALAARRPLTATDIEAWRDGATRSGVSMQIEPWLDFTSKVLVDRSINGAIAMRSAGTDWTVGLVATIQVATDPAVSPTDLMTVHAYWINTFEQARSGIFVATDVEALVSRAWLRMADQAFRLRNPAVTVPPLKSACTSTSMPWPKIGSILLAAVDAIPASVPAEMVAAFRRLLVL